jgi:membrane-bound lytic murein transglycosylase D
MLKRKMVTAGLFANGLFFTMATVNGGNDQEPVDSAKTVEVDPAIRHLQAFDSSFIDLTEFPAIVLADAPKIKLNSNAVKFVSDYAKKNDEALEKIRERGDRYFPMMDSIFSRYHLPLELKYLAAVESELKAKAVSRVGAVGPWQLMAPTARELSLKIRGKYDERTNYYKSTVAAAKYLRDLYREFGDWLLVIAAYNSGPGKVQSAIKMAGSHNFWRLQRFLPAETRGHVKRFIAIHYFFEDYGGITTMTKAEVAAYKKQVSEFIAKQKTELARVQSTNHDINQASGENPEKGVTKTIAAGEMKLNEQNK